MPSIKTEYYQTLLLLFLISLGRPFLKRSMFRLKHQKKESVASRMQRHTITKCDHYPRNDRPTINWRIKRWEYILTFHQARLARGKKT